MPVMPKAFHARWLAFALCASVAGCGGGGSGGGSAPTTTPTASSPLPNTVSGTVQLNGTPLPGVTITVFNTNTNPSTVFATTVTDANGDYSVPGLSTSCECVSNYQFVATKAGLAFNPVMASNPSGNRTGYLWNSAPQNWYVTTGAIAIRADMTGSFSGTAGGSAMLFNVINFNSVANNSVTGANFNAFDGTNPLVALAATGQQVSYVPGDDGATARGVAWPLVRYVDNHDGTVTDHLTGLIWLRNAGCFVPTPWTTALQDVNALASGACGLTDGSSAGQWRLPNVVELESLVDVSTANPALTAGNPFQNVSTGIYWTSTPYYGGQQGSTSAWAIRLADGRYINDSVNNAMATANNAIWAVKGGASGAVKLQATGAYVPSASGDDGTMESGVPLPAPRMRDNGNGTVTDTVTGLIWLKQGDCIQQTWAAAIAAVGALASGQCGLSDGSLAGSWRMPNRNEMQSLADRARNNMADWFDEAFVSNTSGVGSSASVLTRFVTQQYYWTATTDAADTTLAWTVYSCDFGVYDTAKTATGYSMAVR